MKAIRSLLACAAVVCFVVGCSRENEAALNALKELTTQLEATANEHNQTLTKLTKELKDCEIELAKVQGSTAVVKEGDGTVALPKLEGDVNLATLEAHKVALNTAIDKQKSDIESATSDKEKCASDLETEREKAAAAAAAAAAEAKAKAKPKPKPKKKRKPKMVRDREAQGKPTTGVGSRY